MLSDDSLANQIRINTIKEKYSLNCNFDGSDLTKIQLDG